MPVSDGLAGFVEWSVASLPRRGQVESGDCFVVKSAGNEVLVAAVDGVGHGEEASIAAHLAADTLGEYFGKRPITGLIEECHERLRGSRGAVVSLALLNASDNVMTWIGVGSVEGNLLRTPGAGAVSDLKSKETLLLRAGVVGGHQLPRLSAERVPLSSGDLVVFATDGIRPEFVEDIRVGQSPQRLAQSILERFALETDDALVLVVRYLHDRNDSNRR